METLIRYRVLLGMIWVFTVYLCPTKRMVGLCGLISMYENIYAKCRKAWHVIFFLGYFFLIGIFILQMYICIHFPCNSEWTSTHVYVLFVLFLLKKIFIENLFSFVEKLNFSFVLPSDVWLISAHHHGRILGGGGKFRIRVITWRV